MTAKRYRTDKSDQTLAKEVDTEKPLDVTEANELKNDVKVYGNGDMFQLLCKASSKNECWMKSTKAMEIPDVGCVVQVTTQAMMTIVKIAKLIDINFFIFGSNKFIYYADKSHLRKKSIINHELSADL